MRTFACCAAVLLAALDAAAQDNVGARYRFWKSDLDGHFRADESGVPGTFVDLKDDIGLEDTNLNDVAIWAGIPTMGKLYVDYWWGTYEGDMVLTQDITVSGTTYSMGDAVHSEVEWRALTALYAYDFGIPLGGETLPFSLSLSPRGGIKYLRLRTEVTGSSTTTSMARAPIPVIGAAAELSTPYFSAVVEFDGLLIQSFEGFTGKIYDIAIAVRGQYEFAFAGIGYRKFAISLSGDSADVDNIEVSMGISGFFVEAGVKF